VKFSDLGLVVIDEEQRFGVTHKERLKRVRKTVDVLTMSATPIPRTLHMSMVGLRDISSLTTAPQDRRSVVTEVMPYDKMRIKTAILRELQREGQTYFVHNRVNSIQGWRRKFNRWCRRHGSWSARADGGGGARADHGEVHPARGGRAGLHDDHRVGLDIPTRTRSSSKTRIASDSRNCTS
jgi:hypothetical protein